MPFTVHKISDKGVSHPVVARLAVQTSKLIQFSGLPKEQQSSILDLYINSLQPRLVQCHDIHDRMRQRLDESVASLKPQVRS